jgi:hypothetical protein
VANPRRGDSSGTRGPGKSIGVALIDPYIEDQLRTADRLGILKGVGISEVQWLAIKILNVLDKKTLLEDHARSFKESLVSFDAPSLMEDLFPEYFPTEEVDDISGLPAGANLEFANTMTGADMEEAMKIMGISR